MPKSISAFFNKDILTILTKMASKDVKLTEGQYDSAMLGDEDD